jgi:phosphinothricin acetyltransferase
MIETASASVRRAVANDAAAIAAIYNDAILKSTATFDTAPKTVEDRRAWLAARDTRHPVLVLERQGEVIGWSSIHEYSDRQAYADTAETAIYVDGRFRGQGFGRKLKQATIDEARALGFHCLIARITEDSEASLKLNLSAGFERVGTLREVGRKFGRLLDVHILQKIL